MTNSIFLVLSEKVLENKFEVVDKFETSNLFEAQKLFKKKFGIADDKQACFNENGVFTYLERKNLSENVFDIRESILSKGIYTEGKPDIAIRNFEEVMRLYFPERLFEKYQRGVNNLEHQEVKKNMSYEFGDFDAKGNWHRTSPKDGEYIGFYFGNRLPDCLHKDEEMPKLVKRITRKINRKKEEHFLIFKREKNLEKITSMYK